MGIAGEPFQIVAFYLASFAAGNRDGGGGTTPLLLLLDLKNDTCSAHVLL